MFHPHLFENSRPDGFPVLEIEETEGARERQVRRFVPLKRTALGGEVVGPLAQLRLVQTFGYTRDQFDKSVEALYRFPLPGDAAVTGVTVRFGETQVKAHLAEREKAEEEYETAKQEGRQAALTTRESPDVFTLRLAGIKPDEEVTVETAYVQAARPADGAKWSLRVPLTTSPRYVRDDEAENRGAQGQPLALLRDPGHRFTMDLTLPGATDIRSDTHKLEVTTEETSSADEPLAAPLRRIRLADGEVVPDRDLVLSWRPDAGGAVPPVEAMPRLQVWLNDLPSDQGARETYFLAQVAPPRQPATDSGVGREVILLVDHSGSMEGAKWNAADWAVTRFLSGLTERDTFALGLFHNDTRWFRPQPQAATPKAVQDAEAFLRKYRDSGGTELGVALEQALALPRNQKEPQTRHLLIVTDAEVSDAGRILRLVDVEAAIPDPWVRRRISVLCIDASPNTLLASELAERGGGVARFLTSDPAEEDITTALDALLEDWAEPVYAHLRLVVDRPGAETSAGHGIVSDTKDANASEKTYLDLGDLPGGRLLFVTGRVRRTAGDDRPLTFRATLNDGREITGPVRFSAERLERAAEEHVGLKSLFGARRVLGLERLMTSHYSGDELKDRLRRLGYAPDTVLTNADSGVGKSALYPENREVDAKASLKSLLVRESLRYGIACSETAFVATRSEKGQPVSATIAVANALPSGWSETFVGAAMPVMAAAPTGMAFAPPPSPSPAYGGPVPPPSGAPRAGRSRASFLGGLFGSGANAKIQKRAAPPAEPDMDIMASAPAQRDVPAFFRRRTGSDVEAEEYQEEEEPEVEPLFAGVPVFTDGVAVLYDSGEPGASALPGGSTLTKLEVQFPNGAPDGRTLGQGVVLLLYVDDLATPRARVRLADILRQGGARPLNVHRQPGQRIRVTLADEDGIWTGQSAPEMIVRLT